VRRLPAALALAGLGLACAGPPPPAAAGEEPADLSDVLRPIRERFDVPAMWGAVLVGDGLAGIGVDGVRRRGSPDRATTADRVHLGSCTKAMTATLAATLVSDRTLSWDATVPAAFPGLAKVDPGWKGATLAHLVTNRAGAPPDLDADGLWGRLWAHGGTHVEQRMALVEGVLSRPPRHAPGSKTLYANAGFAIAGAMAEAAAKRPWEDLLRERLFAPLEMGSAGFGAPGTKESLDEPRGHREDGAPVEPGPGADNPAAIGPAGTVHSSLPDWAKFASLHLLGEERGGLGLAKEDFRRLHEPPGGSEYAMGWAVTERDWAGGRVLTHAGSNTMWFAVVWLAPKKGFGVLAACNQGGEKAQRACDEASGALVRWAAASRKPAR
jgi:CubicO group peptidase (beta-lactamase class C family)